MCWIVDKKKSARKGGACVKVLQFRNFLSFRPKYVWYSGQHLLLKKTEWIYLAEEQLGDNIQPPGALDFKNTGCPL